jgi:hypothetical protein
MSGGSASLVAVSSCPHSVRAGRLEGGLNNLIHAQEMPAFKSIVVSAFRRT